MDHYALRILKIQVVSSVNAPYEWYTLWYSRFEKESTVYQRRVEYENYTFFPPFSHMMSVSFRV